MAARIRLQNGALDSSKKSASSLSKACDTVNTTVDSVRKSLDTNFEYKGKADTVKRLEAVKKRIATQKSKMDAILKMYTTVETKLTAADKAGVKYANGTSVAAIKKSTATFGSAAVITGAATTVVADVIASADAASSAATTTNQFYQGNHQPVLYNAWQQGGTYIPDIWGDKYTNSSESKGCATSATAGTLSGLLEKDVLPKDVIAANGGGVGVKWYDVANKYDVTWNSMYEHDGIKYAMDDKVAYLDKVIENYQNDPSTYAAPLIHAGNHWVIITGKNSDGSYSCIDSSGNGSGGAGCSQYVISNEYKLNGETGVFTGNLVGISQFKLKK